MKNSILKNSDLNKLSKNEYDVYNILQRYKKITIIYNYYYHHTY